MQWPSDPLLLVVVALTAIWYARGMRLRPSLRTFPGGRPHRRREQLWRDLAFYAALLTIVFALGALDNLADELFSVHMAQHTILMLVSAPLLALAAPWTTLWRPLSLDFRRSTARAIAHSPPLRPLRAAAGWIARPIPAWILFNGCLAAWHVPAAYDLTLRSPAVHYLEHLSFIAFGVLFWAQLVDSPPFRSRLGYFERAVYASAGAAATWVLAVVLELAAHPLYPAYAELHHRPGGLSALNDQQLAGGVMLGPGSIPYAIVVFWCLYRWLEEEPEQRKRPRRPRAGRPALRGVQPPI